MAVDDGLGHARGATRVDDPEWRVEGQPPRRPAGGRRRRARTAEVVDRPVGGEGRQRAVALEIGQRDHVANARELREHLAHDVHAVVRLATIDVPVAGHEERRLDLAEAIENADRPHVGRAKGPDAAHADGGEERDDRLGNVRQIGRHPVPRLDAELDQAGRKPRHPLAQLPPGELPVVAAFAAMDDGGPVRVADAGMAQDLVRVVEREPGEPSGAGHAVFRQHRLRPPLVDELEVLPDRRPEGVEVGDRPTVQRLVVVEAQAMPAFEPVEIGRHLDRCAVFHGLVSSDSVRRAPRARGLAAAPQAILARRATERRKRAARRHPVAAPGPRH